MNENHFDCIYRMVFPNGKSYIGQSTSLNKRISQHVILARLGKQDCPKLNNALRFYNFQFRVDILAENISSVEERNKLEQKFIAQYDTISSGYNCCIGGESCINPETGKHVSYNTGKFKHDENGKTDYPRYYYEKNVEHIKEYKKNWRMKNRAHCNEYSKNWRISHGVKAPSNHKSADLALNEMFPHVPNKDSFYRIFRAMFGGGRTLSKNFIHPKKSCGYLNEWGNWLFDER